MPSSMFSSITGGHRVHGAMDDVSEQPTTQPRPSQVTAAGLIVMLGSVLVVLLMWDRISHLNTVETRTSLKAFLDRSKLQDDGLDVGSLSTIVKVVSMVCAALGVAMAVQGWQINRRSRHARVALTVLTVPLFVTALVGDGMVESAAATFWCSGVSAAVLTLWLGPARGWFGDASPTLRNTGPAPGQSSESAPPSWPPTAPPHPSPQPPPTSFPLATPPQGHPTGQVTAPPAPWTPPPTSAYDAPRPPLARPRALLWACVLTWVCTGLAIAGLAVSLVVMGHDSDSVLDRMYKQNPQLADQGFSRHTILGMVVALTAVAMLAAIAAAVFAVLVFLRHHWAWFALLGSASLAALLFLLASFSSPVGVVLLGACVATIAFLVRPEVRAWLLRR